MERKLTAKQEKFIHGVLSGLSKSEAYRRAYNAKNMSVETIAVKACNLAKQDKIKVIIEQRQKKIADREIWSREKALSMLRDIADEAVDEKGLAKPQMRGVAVRAIEQANKMCGYNAPDNLNVAVGTKLEDLIK